MWRRCSCANGVNSLHSQRHRLALFPAVPMGSQGPPGNESLPLVSQEPVKSRAGIQLCLTARPPSRPPDLAI